MMKLWEDHEQVWGGLDCFGTMGVYMLESFQTKKTRFPFHCQDRFFCEVIWTAQAWPKSLFCEN